MPKNIIKNQSLDLAILTRRNLVKNRVVEARNEALRIVAAAEERATEIVSQAGLEAENMRLQAYNEGRESALTEFTEIITAAYEKRETALGEVEQDVLKLSIKLAEKIIGREIKNDPKTIADIVANALRNIRQQQRLTVRIHPLDLPKIEEFKSTFAQAGRMTFLDFEPDPKVNSGGCIIESEVGTVDARLETQLKILERALLRQAEEK